MNLTKNERRIILFFLTHDGMIESFTRGMSEETQKYTRQFFMRTLIENSRVIKWVDPTKEDGYTEHNFDPVIKYAVKYYEQYADLL
jgi:hypothetical protein